MMKKQFKPFLNLNIQHFAEFDPDNVLLSDARTGEVPSEQGSLTMREFMANSVAMQLATPEPMTTLKKKFSYLADGPGAYWVGEGKKIETSKATWLEAEMEAKKLGVILPVSNEFLKYSVSDFFTQMRPAIAEAFYLKFDQAALFNNDSPYAAGTSVWENIVASGNSVALGTEPNLYLDLNEVVALVEDGDNDANGFTTTRRFRKNLRGEVDQNNKPIFNEATQGAPASVLGEALGYVSADAWDYSKAHMLTGDWNYARYGILQDMEYKISEDATISSIVDENGEPINLFERDLVALRVTMYVGFMTLKEDAFAALTPAAPSEPQGEE